MGIPPRTQRTLPGKVKPLSLFLVSGGGRYFFCARALTIPFRHSGTMMTHSRPQRGGRRRRNYKLKNCMSLTTDFLSAAVFIDAPRTIYALRHNFSKRFSNLA
jgi:hypothetical protein